MAYIPVNPGTISGKARYRCAVKDFSGGLVYTDDPSDLEDNQVSALENLLVSGSGFISRNGVRETDILQGTFHSLLREEYSDCRLFHCGSVLYRFDGETLYTLSDTVPDEKSVLWRLNNKVYLATSGGHMYQVDESFSCEEVEPYIPTVMESKDISMTSFTVKEACNMLTPWVKADYYCGTTTAVILTLPYEMDTSKTPRFYLDGVRKTDVNYSSEGNKRLYIGNFYSGEGTLLTVEYAATGAEFTEYAAQIYGCELAVCFGGSTAGGTRVFLTGNEAYPGQYFCSELADPLYFPDTRRETLGDGSENVVDAEKRYEKLYFFTRRHIYAMSYSFNENEGASFTVSEINTSVGCGMKGSVQLIDNTLVFAHRREGIFLLQSTDIFDELNVRSISQNISTGGVFAGEGPYASCDCHRRYYLYDGSRMLVWDYGTTPYYNSGDTGKAGRRLCWQTLSGFDGCAALFSLAGQLYLIRSRGGNVLLAHYDPEADTDSFLSVSEAGTVEESQKDFRAVFTTKDYDFGYPDQPKRLYECSFSYRFQTRTPAVTLHFYGDGEEFYTVKADFLKKQGVLRLRIPPYSACRFRVGAEVSGGKAELRSLVFGYYDCPRLKHR